jgi:KDO2-lipid IV(A) lauroyltransferase
MPQSGPALPPFGLRLGLNVTAAGVRLLGRRRYRLSDALGNAAFALQPERRRVTIRNYRAAFPELDRWEARRLAARSFREYARTSLDFLYAHHLPRTRVVSEMQTFGVEANLDPLNLTGHGGILVTIHYGSWDVPGAFALAHRIDLTGVMADEGNPTLANLVIWARAEIGFRVVLASRSPRTLLRTLRSGKWVALVADIPGETPSVVVPFLGHLARFSTAPAALAARTGAPLVPATCVRRPGGGYLVEVHPPVWIEPGTDPATALGQIIPVFEAAVRRWPEQWYPFNRDRFIDLPAL